MRNIKYLFINILSIYILSVFLGCAKTQEQKEIHTNNEEITIKIEGTVYPFKEQKIISPVNGYVKEVYVKKGDMVKKGDKLYSLDKELIAIDINNLKEEIASLEKIRENIVHRGTNVPTVNLSAQELMKMSSLSSQGYASEFELNTYKKSYINAITNNSKERNGEYEKIEKLNIEISQKKLKLKQLKYQYDHSDGFSRIDGFISQFDLEPGKYLNKNDKIGLIVYLDKVIVRAGFAKGLLPFIYKGKKVKINFITTPPYALDTTIKKVSPIIDPAFERMTIDLVVPNKNYILQPTTRALVVVPLKEEEQKEVKKYFIQSDKQTVLEVKSTN